MNAENWNKKPGSFDTLNTFYRPKLSEIGIPIIKNQNIRPPNRLVMYKNHKQYQSGDALHFFIDDYRFEHLWNHPEKYLSRIKDKVCFTPDFSLFSDYPDPILRWNVYRARWLGAFWQHNGISVIPTVSWSTPQSFKFCFDGIEPGTTVALSTRGVNGYEKLFTLGIDELIKVVNPEKILCYGSFRRYYRGKHVIENIVIYPNSRNFGVWNSGIKEEHRALCEVS